MCVMLVVFAANTQGSSFRSTPVRFSLLGSLPAWSDRTRGVY